MKSKQTKILNITLLGSKSSGKHTIIKSFNQVYGSKCSLGETPVITVKDKQFEISFNIGNTPDRVNSSFLKTTNIAILCFRTDDHSSYEQLLQWNKLLDDYEIDTYALLGNHFNEPYYSLDDIIAECKDFNETNKVKYQSLDMINFSNTDEVKKFFEEKLLTFKLSSKKKKDEGEKCGNSCLIF